METAIHNGSIKASIKEFISNSIQIDRIDDEEDLFDTGIVNSLFSIQLVTFVEKKFNITVTVDDLDIENFKSVSALYSFVKNKIGLL
jgi:methoxymalonate biosynthesis acyl carrier protein